MIDRTTNCCNTWNKGDPSETIEFNKSYYQLNVLFVYLLIDLTID